MGSEGNRSMEYIDEFCKALDEISYNPTLTRDQWRQTVDAKVRELIEKYRKKHSQESTVA